MEKEDPRIVYSLGNNLYLNITNKCSNNCVFCFKNFSKGVGGSNLQIKEEPTAATIISELIEKINSKNWTEIVFCGFGEPTERLDCILEVTRWIRKHYGKPLIIRVNTNGHGYVLNRNRKVAKELKEAGVDKVSVSLNAENERIYDLVCRPKIRNAYQSVVEFIEKAVKHLEVEVTAVSLKEVDLQKIKKRAEKTGAAFRPRQLIQFFW